MFLVWLLSSVTHTILLFVPTLSHQAYRFMIKTFLSDSCAPQGDFKSPHIDQTLQPKYVPTCRLCSYSLIQVISGMSLQILLSQP